MCAIAMAVAQIGLSLASSAMSYGAANDQANAQNAAYMQNAQAAQKGAVDQYQNLSIRRDQTLTAASQQLFEKRIEALRAQGTAAASGMEGGVQGGSLDSVLGDLFAQQGRREDAISTQFQMDNQEINNQMKSVEAQSQSRINSMSRAAKPSAMPFIIQGVGGALSAVSKGAQSYGGTGQGAV